MPLAANGLLAHVKAPRPALIAGLDRLAVDDRRRGRGFLACGATYFRAQQFLDHAPGAVFGPERKAAVRHLLGRQVVGHHAPSTPAAQHVEDRVDHLAPLVLGRASSRLWLGHQTLDQLPLRIAQVTWISFAFAHRSIYHESTLNKRALKRSAPGPRLHGPCRSQPGRMTLKGGA